MSCIYICHINVCVCVCVCVCIYTYVCVLETDIFLLLRFHNKVIHYGYIFVLKSCKHSGSRYSSIEFLSLSCLLLGPEQMCSKWLRWRTWIIYARSSSTVWGKGHSWMPLKILLVPSKECWNNCTMWRNSLTH